VHAVAPYCYRCPLKLTYPECEVACAKDLKELIETSTSGEIAGFMAEPIMGVGGFITPPKEYFKEAVAIVRQYGGLFICDEVQTGWGRTGDRMFGIEHWDVEPDIMTFAKGMANGIPVGATIARADVADSVPPLSFSTFGGNPVTMRAALATIEVIERENLAHNAKVVGDYLREKLAGLKERYEVIGDVRGMGLMQALEFVKDRKTKEPDPQAVMKIFEETKKHGVLVGKGGLYGNVIRLGPPLIATKDNVDELVTALDAGLSTL
jgi:4-aminobutyrate aminotransferase